MIGGSKIEEHISEVATRSIRHQRALKESNPQNDNAIDYGNASQEHVLLNCEQYEDEEDDLFDGDDRDLEEAG